MDRLPSCRLHHWELALITVKREHGGLTPEGCIPSDEVLDLSVNINYYGPDPELTDYLRKQRFDRYPDPQQRLLKQKLANRHGVSPANLLIGNGATEILWAVARSLLKTATPWLSVEPQFSEFSLAAARCGAIGIRFDARPEDHFQWSLSALAQAISKHKPTLVVLCNPCSPTGFYQDQSELLQMTKDFPQTFFLIDHSFLSLSRWHGEAEYVWPDHVLRLVSLTKDYALAGLRLGYALGGQDLMTRIQAEIPTWSVNSLAQAAGLWICEHSERLAAPRENLFSDHRAMEAELQQRKLSYCPSSTLFTMLRPPHAQSLQEKLWQNHQIIVRSCRSYGLPDWWRLAACPAPSRKRFWTAFDQEFACKN